MFIGRWSPKPGLDAIRQTTSGRIKLSEMDEILPPSPRGETRPKPPMTTFSARWTEVGRRCCLKPMIRFLHRSGRSWGPTVEWVKVGRRYWAAGLIALAGCTPLLTPTARTTSGTPATNSTRKPGEESERLRFVVSFPDSARRGPLTGRVLLFLSNRSTTEPRRIDYFNLPAVYALQVTNLFPGDLVTFLPDKFRSSLALAYPEAMDRLPAGTYYAQAVFDQDQTRADYNAGPDNLYSTVVRCELSGKNGKSYELIADQVIRETPPLDTDWVKFVEVRSRLLSEFHGRELKLRAAVILPSSYHEKPSDKFPALYVIPGFGGRITSALAWINSARGQKWQRGEVPEVPLQSLRIVLDPAVPFGHSVFANSANNGPVGDALVRELIPEIERRFRCLPEARARFLTGHSSGGWAALWLQVAYSDLFGGCWSTAPDPVDFRSFQTFNIY
jgi:hypothetical protein